MKCYVWSEVSTLNTASHQCHRHTAPTVSQCRKARLSGRSRPDSFCSFAEALVAYSDNVRLFRHPNPHRVMMRLRAGADDRETIGSLNQ